MGQKAIAIYENGVLRLLGPLALPEHTRVQVSVEPIAGATETDAHRDQVDEVLLSAGVIRAGIEAPADASPLTAERRAELMRRFSVGRPLSEIILEEREGH